jgi:hypothetical protein
MKKFLLSALFMLLVLTNSFGQWYQRRYNVNDINLLTRDQLEESLSRAKFSLIGSSFLAVSGAGLALLSRYGESDDEDEPFLDWLFGEETMKDVWFYTGLALCAGSLVSVVVCIDRTANIKSTLRTNYPASGSLQISPAAIYCSDTRSLRPGITLTFRF